MKPTAKLLALILICIPTVIAVSACANPDLPSSAPAPGADGQDSPLSTAEPIEEPATEILEEVTNFPVLTKFQKNTQRKYHNEFNREEFFALPWDIAPKAEECPYTTEEVLAAIALGDNIMDVYDRIGYPTSRDHAGMFLSGRNVDLFSMSYETTDGDEVFINYLLAGCCEEDYAYLITEYHTLKKAVPRTEMDFDTKVRLQIIPVFMAVENVGVDYLLEKEIITPYEATLYAEEEAVYQAKLASKETAE